MSYYKAHYGKHIVAIVYADSCKLDRAEEKWRFFLGENLVAVVDTRYASQVSFYEKGGE